MKNVIIDKMENVDKMEKQELLKEYDQCVKALAREAVEEGTINRELWDRIAEIQRALRELDILEEIKKELNKQEIIEIPISKKNYFKPNIKDYINLMPEKDLYNNILKNQAEAIEFVQDQAARPINLPKPTDLPYFEEKLNKMTSPMAANFTQDIAAQPDYFWERRSR